MLLVFAFALKRRRRLRYNDHTGNKCLTCNFLFKKVQLDIILLVRRAYLNFQGGKGARPKERKEWDTLFQDKKYCTEEESDDDDDSDEGRKQREGLRF